MIMLRSIPNLLFFLFFLVTIHPAQLPSAEKPNVILILTDDQGMGDLSFYGNPVIQTPHLDQLAGEGVSFNQFHVTAMCSPTRAALLTGRNPLDNGVVSTCQGLHTIRPEFPTLSEALAAGGYATGIFGKWHLGRNYPNRPRDRGFQEDFVLYGFGPTGISSRWNNDYIDMWVVHNGEEKQTEGFCTDALFHQAMEWMGEKAEAEEPFFAYIPTNAPHFPFWAPEEWTKEFADTKNPEFFAMVKNLDDNMGRLDAFLEENGLQENTIVIFLSDNGPVGGKSTFNAGMTGGKATPWEGGHRVPLFIRYPAGQISGGRVVEELCDVTDLFPTLLDLCGVPAPEDGELTGVSLKETMRGEARIPERTLFMHIQQHDLDPKMAATMSGKWRLLWADALYNIEEDLAQETNVADEHPEVFTRLWRTYQEAYYDKREFATTPPGEVIGSVHQEEVVLDGSNWVMVRGDGQVSVREAVNRNMGPEGGPWKIKAERAGRYAVTISRWPRESGLKLTEGAPPFETVCSGKPLPAGVALPIDHATIDLDGVRYQQAIDEKDPTAIRFELNLEKGFHNLHGIFRDAHGKPLCGAFYAYITKIDDEG